MSLYYIVSYLPKANLNNHTTYEKLLGIILYKNLYPDDFVKINVNDGKLYNIISSREELIKIVQIEPNTELERKLLEKDEILEKYNEDPDDEDLQKKLTKKNDEVFKLQEILNKIRGYSLSKLLKESKYKYEELEEIKDCMSSN